MRRGWPIALLATGLGAVLVLSARFPVRLSGLWAVDAAVTQVIVLWPVIAGITAADAVRLRRSGAVELLRSASTAARARLLLGRSAAVAGWGGLGLLVGVLGAVALAGLHGSPVPWSAWPEVVLALAGIGAAAAVGTAVGAVLRARWLVPPLVAGVGYGALALDLAGASGFVGFAGATDASVTAIVLRPVVLVGELVLLTGAVVAAGAVVIAASGSRRAGTAVAVVVALVMVPAAAWWRDQVAAGAHVWADPARWACLEVGPAAQTCLPPDQERDLVELAGALRPVDARLRELDPTTGDVRYEPGAPGVPRPGVVAVRPPIDTSGRPGQLTWDVVLAVSGCADQGERAWTDDDLAARTRAEVTVARWLTPDLDVSDVVAAWQVTGDGEPLETEPGLASAREALVVLRGCRGAW